MGARMDGTIDRRFVGGVLLAGGVLAMVGNGLHPILDPDSGATQLVAIAGDTAYWSALHLVVVLAVVLLTAGTVLFARGFTGTAGESAAWLAAVLAVIGGSIFALQLGGLDGAVMTVLAEELAAGGDEAALTATASAMAALDVGLLGIVTIVYLGGTFVALGWAMHVTAISAPWIRWTALVAGGAGVVVGTLMYLRVADGVAFYGFRLVALAVTVAALGLAVELRRSEAPAGVPTSAAPA
ncbi:MAG: hypothetical protein KY457_14475 [Actinobacteria bacterium]|nr:hypothetical protein [Actinomycetota bacterium]